MNTLSIPQLLHSQNTFPRYSWRGFVGVGVCWIVVLWFCLILFPTTVSADALLQARLSYRTAYQLFKQQKWSQSQQTFQQTLVLLNKRHASLSGRGKHLNTLGISDIHYHLALIAFQLSQPMAACQELQKVRTQIQTLPADPQTGWTTWPINPLLPERFADANQRFTQTCTSLPSQLQLVGLPANATVEMLQTPGPPDAWTSVGLPVPLLQTSAKLRISVPGYQTQILTVSLPRWTTGTLRVVLKKTPKPRVIPPRIVRRPPPPPPPPRTSPWVWVGVGLGVAAVTAGTIVTVYVLTRPSRPSEVQGKLDPNVWP